MTTYRAIVDALFRAAEANEAVVLATVVRITGSSYGGVGTRMVVRVDGTTVGVVSGGCLETDLAGQAREVNADGRARLVTYDTRADDDAAWGLGLGCNGVIDVLLEPLVPVEARAVASLLEDALSSDAKAVLATVIQLEEGSPLPPKVGAHALVTGGVIETTGDWGDRTALKLASAASDEALEAGRRGMVREYHGVTVAFEVITPAVRLVICGSGPDVIPLVRFADELGWYLSVVDHRPVTEDHAARFPGATLVECRDPLELGDCAPLGASTAAVVMSHHFERDLDYVRALLASDVAYIGVLGPRARTERMLADIKARGESHERMERLYSPVGMDIGGDGPDAIALAIITEVAAVVSERGGGHLRDRKGALH